MAKEAKGFLPTKIKRPQTAFNDPMHGHTYYIHRRKNIQDPEINIFSRDGVRKLRSKSAHPQRSTVVLTPSQLEAIKRAAVEIEVKSFNRCHAGKLETASQLAEEAEKRRQEYRKKEKHFLQLQNKNKDNVAQSRLLQEEIKMQEIKNLEEAKEFNRLVLGVKCQAVRDAQMQEKKELEQREREENLQYLEEMRNTMQKAIIEDREKERIRQEATQLVAKVLTSQIEEAKRSREHQASMRREMEYSIALKRSQEYTEEKKKEENEKKIMKMKQREEALALKEQIRKCKEEQIRREKLDNIKVLNEQIAKQRREDEMKEEEKERRKTTEQMRDLWLVEEERQIREHIRRQEIKRQREQEEEERLWRGRVLQEEKMKKEKQEKETAERKLQLRSKEEKRLEEKLQEMKENREKSSHSIISQEREERDRKRDMMSKLITKTHLQDQISLRNELIAKEVQKAKREQEELIRKQQEQDQAFVALQETTMKQLREMNLSPRHIKDLERRAQKLRKSVKKF